MNPKASARQMTWTLRGLRWRLLVNHLADLVQTASRVRLLVILGCSLVFWTGLFGLFFEGFHFLSTFVKLSNEIIEYLFNVFFLSLLVMLVFSTGIILYAGLFFSRETEYLLTTPASCDRIFAYKFTEAIAFSSWGFLLLGSPMMVAYGLRLGADWSFYAVFAGFLAAFVVIPGALGGMGAILVARFIPRRKKAVLATLTGVLSLLLVWQVVRLWRTPGDVLSRDWLDNLLAQLSFTMNPLLPSRWISKGLLSMARGHVGDGLFYLAVTAANAGMAYLLASILARDLLRTAYSRVQGGLGSRKRARLGLLDHAAQRCLGLLPSQVRLLLVKDLRSFLRDPAQWSQFLIFFGLLALYFFNIRRLGYHIQNDSFRYLLSFLNLAVTALLLSTFTSRFIFPLLSLEGRNFWILGLLPVRRSQIVWGKFAFSVGITLLATEALILISDGMLRVGPLMTTLHVAMVALLCLGLSAISVGLGARLPNLKEDDPSKIAVGVGGTLNLLVSLVFILVEIGLLALPCLLILADPDFSGLTLPAVDRQRLNAWLLVAMIGATGFGLAVTTLSLRMGIRAFERMEF